MSVDRHGLLKLTPSARLGRFSRTELHRLVSERNVSRCFRVTIGRWLAEYAINPWQQR